MPLETETAAIATAPETAQWATDFLAVLSRLGPVGLVTLASDCDSLARLADTESRDIVTLSNLAVRLRIRADRLTAWQITD